MTEVTFYFILLFISSWISKCFREMVGITLTLASEPLIMHDTYEQQTSYMYKGSQVIKK